MSEKKKPVSSLEEFKSKSVQRLELPSGLVIEVRRVSPLDYAGISGHLPAGLLTRIKNGEVDEALAAEAIAADADIIKELIRAAIIAPAGLDPALLLAEDFEAVRCYAMGEVEKAGERLGTFPGERGHADPGSDGKAVEHAPQRHAGSAGHDRAHD